MNLVPEALKELPPPILKETAKAAATTEPQFCPGIMTVGLNKYTSRLELNFFDL
jgi:hypothetical protein